MIVSHDLILKVWIGKPPSPSLYSSEDLRHAVSNCDENEGWPIKKFVLNLWILSPNTPLCNGYRFQHQYVQGTKNLSPKNILHTCVSVIPMGFYQPRLKRYIRLDYATGGLHGTTQDYHTNIETDSRACKTRQHRSNIFSLAGVLIRALINAWHGWEKWRERGRSGGVTEATS